MDNSEGSRSRQVLIAEAVEVAKAILAGTTDPHQGCDRIGAINQELGWPDELTALGMLAHEQSGHEHVGITAEGCVAEIMEECRRLVGKEDLTRG